MQNNSVFTARKTLDSHIRNVNLTPENNNQDAQEILAIYGPFITDTTVTFEYKVPSLQDFKERITAIANNFPYLVYEENGYILGYAYASKYHVREAYKFSVDLSIYIEPNAHGKGIGTALYDALCTKLKKAGFRTAYALITSPNIPSEHFHEKYGFKNLALFEKTGYKFGKWIDVRFMQLQLNEYSETPNLTYN